MRATRTSGARFFASRWRCLAPGPAWACPGWAPGDGLPGLPGRSGEPQRSASFYGLHAKRGICDGRGRRCARRLPARRARQRRGAGAFAVRSIDGLACAVHHRTWPGSGAVRIWRRGAPPGAGRCIAGQVGICLYSSGRSDGAGLCAQSGCRIGREADEVAPRSPDAAIRFARCGESAAAGAACRAQRRPC